MDHAFVIPAYRESPFLEECVRTLVAQRLLTHVLIKTSTPNEHIARIAKIYRIPVLVNSQLPGIASDWNFALTATEASLVTIAHQDDLYSPQYTARALDAFHRFPDAVLAFSRFDECSADGPRPLNANLLIKRALTRQAFGFSEALASTRLKRRLLALGNPICCPSVIFNRRRIAEFRFTSQYKSNLDWDAWERLAAEPGQFVYLRDTLVSHRVHRDTETTASINGQVRDVEDRELLNRFWRPSTVAALAVFYRLSYLANRA